MIGELAEAAALARRLVESDTPGTLSTLFSVRGSTYRPLGSMMVSLPGRHAGGISGGCLEEYVARVGERATRSVPAVMMPFNTHPDSDDAIPVTGCGGSIELLVERLTPDHVIFLERFSRAAQQDACSLVACVAHHDGESLSVTRDWWQIRGMCGTTTNAGPGGICAEAVRDAKSVHKTIAPDTSMLVQYIPPLTRLVIFGAGDDARPLCEIAAKLGWHVSVADRRARFATDVRFPDASAVLSGDWEETVNAITFSARTVVVLMTHDLDDDVRLLSLLRDQPLAYLGALGPAHRRRWLLEQAAALPGGRSDIVVPTLHGPIGLDLGDRSAAGIAVAVVAEILAVLNGPRRGARDEASCVEAQIGRRTA